MKGLLLKDAYMIGKLCRAIILIDILFIALSFWGDGNMFFIVYPCILSGMLPMTLISYDEREKWDKYAGTLPYTRAQMVSAKYVIGLCGNGIVWVLTAAAQAFRMANGGELALKGYLALLMTLMAVSLIAPASLYPLVFRFGAEKGRIFYYIVIGAACAGSMFLTHVDTALAAKRNALWISAVLFAAAVLLYTASWLLAVVFYRKREL